MTGPIVGSSAETAQAEALIRIAHAAETIARKENPITSREQLRDWSLRAEQAVVNAETHLKLARMWLTKLEETLAAADDTK